jgi:hypothetical protein
MLEEPSITTPESPKKSNMHFLESPKSWHVKNKNCEMKVELTSCNVIVFIFQHCIPTELFSNFIHLMPFYCLIISIKFGAPPFFLILLLFCARVTGWSFQQYTRSGPN